MQDWRFPLVPAPAPGQKTQGFVDWGDPVVSGWDWPYVAIRGAAPGPAVLVTAGVHGSEYVSIDAVVQLGAMLDPAAIHGQVLCLPLLNPAAFEGRVAYVSPVDTLNVNRTFPGKAEGSMSERLAWLLSEKAIRGADALLDLHGGDLPEALFPFSLYYETGDAALDERSRAMAVAFGSPAVIVHRQAGAPIAGLTVTTAGDLGVPAIIAEDGGVGIYDPALAARMRAGAENLLRSLGSLEGPVRVNPPPRVFSAFVWLRSETAGFFKPAVAVGAEVAAGTVLGTIRDFFGRTVETIVSPVAGQLLFLVVSPAIGRDGLICGIGRDPLV
jgi:predicted deacylase